MKQLVHEIHVSEIRLFKKCRFAHQMKFVGMLYPKITAKPLEFGTAFHAAKQVFYDPQTNGYPADARKELAILKFVEVCKAQEEELGSGITIEQRMDYQERIELGMGMLEYYFGTVAPVEDINYESLAVEQTFSVPIVNPDTKEPLMCKCDRCWAKIDQTDFDEDELRTEAARRNYWDGLPVHLEGQIDLILRDKRTNKIWILDWKTTARLMDKWEWLELDEQVTNYAVALWLLGKDVAGFIYHEALKTFPKPPSRNKSKRMGRWYSVDKNQDTDYDMYVDEISLGDAEGLESGAYDEFLDWLRDNGKPFYHRETIRRNNEQLAIAYKDLYDTAREMVNPLKVIYPSPGKFNCTYCEFLQVCIGRATGADYQYTIDTMFEQKAPYYERR
ncbi:Gp73 protein [Candidatus Vecturithrix granuli]|uniref:Gp73 protein n=1 Tax=Vecturithrix granuli TaxID=1499967 RepID=A0A081CB05_VECG1|nr:Gp73 protein [Candidatus Vecturithrix granuli]